MTILREVRMGAVCYMRDDEGFWIAEHPTDPMSATITTAELMVILKHTIERGEELRSKMEVRLETWRDYLEQLEGEVARLKQALKAVNGDLR